jgi:hypothetical protein
MKQTPGPRQMRAKKPVGRTQAEPRLPHERDESSDSQEGGPRGVIEKARVDIESGQQDTDMHGIHGLEKPEKRRGK